MPTQILDLPTIDADELGLRVREVETRTDELLQRNPSIRPTASCSATCASSASTCSPS
jgi:hypothetical protein